MFLRGAFCLLVLLQTSFAQTLLTLPPLPYSYNELEPVISEEIMRLHHDGHMQSYTNATNEILKAMANDPQKANEFQTFLKKPVDVMLTDLEKISEPYRTGLRHQAGGFWNHKLFFPMLRKPSGKAEENRPTGELLKEIEASFGSFEKFQEVFSAASQSLFGSGWVWLYIEGPSRKLVMNWTANQDNPIMFDKDNVVVLAIDLWEHAYYLTYKNRRAEYIKNFWRIVNWDHVSKLFIEGRAKRSDL